MIVPSGRRGSPPACAPSETRAAPPTWAGSTTAGSASTTASPTSPPRSASPSSRSSTRCWSGRSRVAGALRRGPRRHRGRARRRSPGAAEERRSWFVYVVRLPDGADRDAIDRPARRARRRQQGLPALHPPLPAPARARLPRGPVPGRRSRLGALAGAALLPVDDRVPGRPRVLRGSRPPIRTDNRHSMSRFRKDPDPRFWRLNRSIEFDWRLAPYDIDQSQAHARGLREIGVLDDEELARSTPASSGSAPRWASTASSSTTPTRTSTWRSSACSARRSARSPASSTPAARATTRSPPTWRWSSRRTRCGRSSWPGRRWSACSASPSATATGRCPATPTCSAPSPSTSATTCSPTSGCSPATSCASSSPSTAPAVMPLGSGALAGVNWEIDRGAVADDLGFDHVSPNSIDGASNRDFVLDYLAAASACAMHLSRLGSEIVIWSSSEFGFCELDESFSSGSSIMPQKVNPDSAELLRAKSPRVAADYASVVGMMHALPLTYGKDMQEDKEPLFDAIDTVELCLDATAGMLAGIEFDRERLEAASGDEMLAATEIADLLVRKGVPFREAHGIVGGLVRDAVEQGRALSDLTPEELRERSEHLDELLLRGAEARAAGWSRSGSRAAPAPSALARQIDAGPRDPRRRSRRGCSKSGPSACAASERGAARGRVLRSLGPRGRPRADRLPSLLRRLRRDRSSRPRATSATTRPATPTSASPSGPRFCSARRAAPTSTSPTASTACSTRSPNPRARRRRC